MNEGWHRADEYLPHVSPAILLERFRVDGEHMIEATVQLDQLVSKWYRTGGLPMAFGMEMLGQASALFLRHWDSKRELVGGRLAACEHFAASVDYLPLKKDLRIQLVHDGGSSLGYHKFRGVLSGRVKLVEARFSVIAIRQAT